MTAWASVLDRASQLSVPEPEPGETFEPERGVVANWDASRGFGFIAPAAVGNKVFVHLSALQSSGLTRLDPGDRVEFCRRLIWGRVQAVKVRMIEGVRSRRLAAVEGVPLVAPSPVPPPEPAAAGAWAAYLAHRKHLGNDHAEVVRADIRWGEGAQRGDWTALAEWFEAVPPREAPSMIRAGIG